MVESKHVECYGPLGPLGAAIKFESRTEEGVVDGQVIALNTMLFRQITLEPGSFSSSNVLCVPQRTPIWKKILNVESIHKFKLVTGKFCIQFHLKKMGNAAMQISSIVVT